MAGQSKNSNTFRFILTPDDQEFWEILSTARPPGWRGQVTSDFTGHMACRVGSWLPEPLEGRELEEFMLGGEMEEPDDADDRSLWNVE